MKKNKNEWAETERTFQLSEDLMDFIRKSNPELNDDYFSVQLKNLILSKDESFLWNSESFTLSLQSEIKHIIKGGNGFMNTVSLLLRPEYFKLAEIYVEDCKRALKIITEADTDSQVIKDFLKISKKEDADILFRFKEYQQKNPLVYSFIIKQLEKDANRVF
jgi:hypothetical protein